MTFEVGDYRATELIGAGGSAQVWRGVVGRTGAVVAIKVFPPEQLAVARREAALASAVDHPHVIRVLDVVGDTERAALITEFADGGDLAELLARRGRLSAGETLTVLLPLASALATAHERQIVHGDLSSQNVLFDGAGRPLLADLGAGRAVAESGRPVSATPDDAAPELARGGIPGPATDVFSLGSLALACLTGRHAWPADDLRDVLIQAAAGQWPDPDDDDGPPLLIGTVRAMLEHDPERRPGAASVVMDLRSAGRPVPLDMDGQGTICGAVVIGPDDLSRQKDEMVPDTGLTRGGRHGREHQGTGEDDKPVSSRRAAGPSGHVLGGERLDLRRVGRARAVTRARSDAVPHPEPPPMSRMQRFRALAAPRSRAVSGRPDVRPSDVRTSGGSARSRPGRVSTVDPSGGSVARRAGERPIRGRAVRLGALVLAAVVVAVLAGAGGLWWATWDRTDPVAVDQIGVSGVPGSVAPPTRATVTGVSTGNSPPRNATSANGSPRVTAVRPAPPSAPRSAGTPQAATPSAGTRPGAALPAATAPSATAPSAAAPSAAVPRAASPSSAPSTSGRGSSPASSSTAVPMADFTTTVRALDDARARALVTRDAALLDAVYTADSVARSADARMIATLISGGLRLSGAVHQVRTTRVVGSSPLRVEVDDVLPAYSLLDAGGRIVGTTAARAASARVMVLVRTPGGYRISAVQSA